MDGQMLAERRQIDGQESVIVMAADPWIWISPDLLQAVKAGDLDSELPGGARLTGDVLTAGIEGVGVGVVQYRVADRPAVNRAYLAKRVDPVPGR